MTHTILLVEDNPHILKVNRAMLEKAGYRVLCAETAAEALALLETESPALLVLDIMLPDGDGVALCRELRAHQSAHAAMPVLFLSARGKSADIVAGLRAGGDDYLPKPYDLAVLLARVEALLRRAQGARVDATTATAPRLGPLALDVPTMRAFLHGADILLTPREFAILLALVRAGGRPVPPTELYKTAWGMDANDDVQAVRRQVSRLRDKLGGAVGRDFILKSEYGRGYVFRQMDET